MTPRQSHPFYGVGIEWTESLEEGIERNLSGLSCFELIPENFFRNKRPAFLKKLRDAGTPVLIHAVELSIGTDEPLKQRHLDEVRRVADEVNTIHFSDHLCMTEAGGVEICQLTPLPWTEEACDVVCRKIDRIQAQLDLPFLIETIANRFVIPNTELSETEFINKILRRTGCHLLLDLHNIHANACNFDFDPFQWVNEIDLDAVAGIHIAGGVLDHENYLVDSHNRHAPPRVWDLYRMVCSRIRPACTIVEWTEDAPSIDDVMDDVAVAREILDTAQRAPVLAATGATL